MNKLTKLYLRHTFTIMTLCWGCCVICSVYNVRLSNFPLLYVPYFLGGLSPTIASWLCVKSGDRSVRFRAWLQSVFNFKHNIFFYILIVLLAAVFFLPQCLISGYDKGAPLLFVPFMLPVMMFCGGLEEAGWRGILQPELEKKVGFTLATVIVALIWWIWHTPLFFIKDVGQYGSNFLTFGINIFALSFALAAIRKSSGSIWLCVLFHSLINSLHGVFILYENVYGNVAAALLLIASSYIVVTVCNRDR